jgi:hypothetical protein
MTDAELITRLRRHRYNTWKDDLGPEVDKALAADRIEALVKEKTALGHMFNAAYNRHVAEVIAVETKLAKAVEALKWQASQSEAHPFMVYHARATLTELGAKP